MKITDHIQNAKGKTLFSFELLPPIKGNSIQSIYNAIDPLMEFNPPFIDVTYHREDYKLHHPKGKKSNFTYRLDTPDRLGKAGIHKMGLGVLIGLEDWRTDSFFTALHLRYLEKTYWKTRYSISFPRLRPFSGGLTPKVEMTDRELIQLICAYRLLDEEVELSLSTRESPVFRDHAIRLGIKALSAGSRTNPGGYAADPESLEQFEIHDDRNPAAIAAMIRAQGYEAVWKDWDQVLQTTAK